MGKPQKTPRGNEGDESFGNGPILLGFSWGIGYVVCGHPPKENTSNTNRDACYTSRMTANEEKVNHWEPKSLCPPPTTPYSRMRAEVHSPIYHVTPRAI
ncbi:hypothetical protein CEXT_88711 [Caerostris extrusa]|uniref:Uncharacterized protein n=1 Tax=Caerostris extrusa TaxID=172846 RepID=A0AAV4X6R2_CAEEX|nr:hypothetical protein CEXT_88711 [Caerostris extrusa]